jgi:hypothetical protein
LSVPAIPVLLVETSSNIPERRLRRRGFAMRSILLSAILILLASYCHAKSNDNLIVFVGRKIDVVRFQPVLAPNEILLDGAFKARYEVLRVVKGSLPESVIEFEAYDHYGTPKFSMFDEVLLFIIRSGDTYYHVKYEYVPVYPTTGGDWASCGRTKGLRPKPVTFTPEVSFDLAELSDKDIRKKYPNRVFEVREHRAYCRRGNSPEELAAPLLRGRLKEINWSQIWLRAKFS